jgi:CRP-like cAMP-binding protein
MFLLKEGCARHFVLTTEGKTIPLFWLRPGDVFGGVALFEQAKPYLASTEMMKESRVFVWHRTLIRDFAVRYPRLADNMLLIAYDYFAWYIATHMALVSQSARQRLAHVTVTLARGIGRKVSGGIELDLTNEELANAANITPFTASRLLSGWQRTGAIVKSRGKILLRSSEQLLSRSDLEDSA